MNNQIVPWFNCEEWLAVYNDVFSSPPSINRQVCGLKTMLIWKARCPSLPSGIESTFSLLQVYIQDVMTEKVMNEHVLRFTYSSAIMRFVNHMLDDELSKGATLYKAAKQLGVPDWIIDLRHDIAHNNTLPSLELLREASKIALQWLQAYYWDQHKGIIKDYVVGELQSAITDEENISGFIHFYTSLSICSHSSCNVESLANIPDDDMRNALISETKELFGDYIDLSDLTSISIKSLIKLVNTQTKKLLKNKDSRTIISKALVGDESLFLSYEMLEMLSYDEFYYNDTLNKTYITCFEILLIFLHSNNIILDLILELIAVTKCFEVDHNKRKHSALWICEILKGLLMLKKFRLMINNK